MCVWFGWVEGEEMLVMYVKRSMQTNSIMVMKVEETEEKEKVEI